MALDLERAGWRIRVGEYVALRVSCAVAFMGVGALVIAAIDVRLAVMRVLVIFSLALAGWFLPRVMLGRRQKRRLEQVEKQLPDAMTAMAKSLQAGAGLYQAMAFAAKETPEPLGPELQRTLRDLNLGADVDDAFESLSERIGSADLNIALTAISIQRTVGGNLSEILMNVTNTVRERAKIKAEVRVLTSKQKMMSNLMALLPVLVALAFIALNPDLGNLLFNTTAGQIALAAGIALELLGLWLVRRLSIIEV
jgi:tight adherence protein B